MVNQKTVKKSKAPLVIGIVAVVLVVLVGGILLLGRGSKKLYEVGKDIEPGEYVLIGEGEYKIAGKVLADNYGYFAICTDKNCPKDEIDDAKEFSKNLIQNDNVFGKAYVILEKGQFLHTNGMKLVKLSDYKANLATSLSFDYSFNIGNDYYKVGKDLAAGTYKITGEDFYYAICSKPTCKNRVEEGEVIDNYFAGDKGNTATVTLEDGQYFVVGPADKPFKMVKE